MQTGSIDFFFGGGEFKCRNFLFFLLTLISKEAPVWRTDVPNFSSQTFAKSSHFNWTTRHYHSSPKHQKNMSRSCKHMQETHPRLQSNIWPLAKWIGHLLQSCRFNSVVLIQWNSNLICMRSESGLNSLLCTIKARRTAWAWLLEVVYVSFLAGQGLLKTKLSCSSSNQNSFQTKTSGPCKQREDSIRGKASSATTLPLWRLHVVFWSLG